MFSVVGNPALKPVVDEVSLRLARVMDALEPRKADRAMA
jgi:hypothetical protein